ncbi:MAG: DUF2442 domain-containing protein [Parvibaculum sp.]|nr:DUF2442 domain-containing protein [Parvibaculum sp.]
MEEAELNSVENVNICDGMLSLVIDGMKHEYSLIDVSGTLANATTDQVNTYEVSPGGYGIHWPLIDEDISIDGLIGTSQRLNSGRMSA